MHLSGAISDANADHQRRFARRIADAVGGLPGKRIAFLGLAFKADTDDVRSSPALRLAARLLAEDADLRAHVADLRKSPGSISETPQADEPRTGRTSLAA